MRNWTTIKQYSDILFDFFEGIAKITINRPEVYNAFRPQTNHEILDALAYCRDTPEVRVVVLTGAATRLSAAAVTNTINPAEATVIPTEHPASMCLRFTKLSARL